MPDHRIPVQLPAREVESKITPRQGVGRCMTREDLGFEFPDRHLPDTAHFATKIRKAGYR